MFAIQILTLIRSMFFHVFILRRHVSGVFMAGDCRGVLYYLVFILYYLCSPKFINK